MKANYLCHMWLCKVSTPEKCSREKRSKPLSYSAELMGATNEAPSLGSGGKGQVLNTCSGLCMAEPSNLDWRMQSKAGFALTGRYQL